MSFAWRAVHSVWKRRLGPSVIGGGNSVLGYISGGEALYRLSDTGGITREHPVVAGTLLWFPEGTLREMQPRSPAVEIHSIQVQTASLPDAFRSQTPAAAVVVRARNPSHIEALYRSAERLWVQQQPIDDLELDALALLIFTQMLKCRRQPNTAPHLQARVAKVLDYMADHAPEADLDLARLAQVAGWSERYLIRVFRQVVGSTPVNYLRRLRVLRGLDLLASGEWTVAEAAYAVGFNDPAYFSRVFARQMGRPPSAYLGVNLTAQHF